MGRINRLPADLANQIAAGEVVERPASIAKELVENAIDAGATRISVHIELGGKKQVRVDDDGEGMEPEDARLSLERHATSKIRRADDLAAIATMGFRGEALPSIASVSHFVLRTRARGQESGTEIRVNGGAIASVAEVGAPEGTRVEVNDVFYNLPARRKFLKSDGAESAQVSRLVTQLALAHPSIGFTLTSAGRTVLQCPPSVSMRDRLFQLYGERADLLEVDVATLVGLLMPAVQKVREACCMEQVPEQPAAVGHRQYMFHDTGHRMLAQVAVADPNTGMPDYTHGTWAMGILPYIEQGPLFQQM